MESAAGAPPRNGITVRSRNVRKFLIASCSMRSKGPCRVDAGRAVTGGGYARSPRTPTERPRRRSRPASGGHVGPHERSERSLEAPVDSRRGIEPTRGREPTSPRPPLPPPPFGHRLARAPALRLRRAQRPEDQLG